MITTGLVGNNTNENFITYHNSSLIQPTVLISCNKNNANSRDALLYWCSNNSDEIKFAKNITDKWNKNNPNDQVKYQPVPEGTIK